MKIDMDRINNADLTVSAVAAFDVANALQHHHQFKAEQAVGCCAAFITLAESMKVNPAELFRAATNLMNHADGRRPEFDALRMYFENEVVS
jgi:hypothetical protein